MHPLADLSVLPGQVAVHWFEQSCYALKDAAGTVGRPLPQPWAVAPDYSLQ